ncbi:MAG: hypothetical protein C4582_07635 [Desulfobacteraceae bacterium]|nr:MAG: hypothetical protein C4582_07635 [Desulfobacteraceae bacterium]
MGNKEKVVLWVRHKKRATGNFSFFEFRKQINGISPVIFNAFITMETTADGTCETDVSHKIDCVRKESFFVFPNGLKSVNVGKLNSSAALPARRQGPWLPQTVWPVSLQGLVVLSRSIPYLSISTLPIPPAYRFCKYAIKSLYRTESVNTGV